MATLPEATAAARRDLTLDLFTRYGAFWAAIRDLRDEWRAIALRRLPPSPPPGSLVALGLVTPLQMPERFHLPPEPENTVLANLLDLDRRRPELRLMTEERVAEERARHTRIHVGSWVFALRDFASELEDRGVVDIGAGGTDDLAWQRWAPFLSACALYDPPWTDLLAFAEHDHRPLDGTGATETTYRRRTDTVLSARDWRDTRLRDIERLPESARLVPALLAHQGYFARAAEAWRPSTVAPPPRRPIGRQPVDPLLAVQCAVLAIRLGWTEPRIGQRFGWALTLDSYDNPRRCKKARHAIGKGRSILKGRGILDERAI